MRVITGLLMMLFWVEYRSRKKESAAAIEKRWVQVALEAQADYMRNTP